MRLIWLNTVIAAIAINLAVGANGAMISFQEVADTAVGYQAVSGHIRSDSVTPSDPSSNLQVGRTQGGASFRGIVGFDISAIPAGSTITEVKLTVTHRRADTGASLNQNFNYELHRLQGGVTESEMTWANRATGTPWTTAGGDFDANILASFTDNPEMVGKYTKVFGSSIDFVAAAQAALNGNVPLNLLIRSAQAEALTGTNRSLVNFISDDEQEPVNVGVFATDAPLLEITYVPEPTSVALGMFAIGSLFVVRRRARAFTC